MEQLAWPDIPRHALVLVPTGSFEQHGPHLPLHTDTTIATAVAERVAHRLAETPDAGPVLVAPSVHYGASGEHQDFPGTMSIGTAGLRLLLVELVRSLSTWAGRIVFVNGHGGNLPALRSAVGQLRDEGHDAGWVPCVTTDGDAHAGHVETSVMLHLVPHQVDLSRAVEGNREALERLLPALVAGGVAAVSPTGILGDPRTADARAGAELVAAMVDDAVGRIRANQPDAQGCLRPGSP